MIILDDCILGCVPPIVTRGEYVTFLAPVLDPVSVCLARKLWA